MKISHLNGLRAFEATLRTGSFRAAAQELGVTPAAVGQQIRSLEDFLGRQLFLRTSAGTTPTELALSVAGRLTSSFSVIGDVLAQLKDHQARNRVAITLPESFAENWFTHRIAEIYRLNSEVDLRLNASNRMVDLVSEDFDFAVRFCAPPDDNYDEAWLFGDHVLPVCSPEFAERHGLHEARKSLEAVPLVHLDSRTPDPQWADWEMWGTTFGFESERLGSGVRITQLSSGLQAAITGQGLVLCGVTEAYNAIKVGQLVMPFGPQLNCPTGYQYRLVSLRRRSLTALQRRFRKWIIETAEEFRSSVRALLCTE
jgi:LysR family glycine cleavage system transcriptional activator